MATPSLLAINNYYYRRGGAEVVFLEHMRLLSELGWQVAPFAMNHPRNDQGPWNRYFIDEIEFGGSYSAWQKLAMAARVVYSRQAQHRLRRLLDDVSFDVAHAHNIYHHLSPAILPVLRERGIPVLLTLHDMKIACPAYKMLTHDGICERCRGGHTLNVIKHRCIKGSAALSTLIYAEATVNGWLKSYDANVSRFVAPSRFMIDKMVEWGWSRDRFAYIPNFVDATEFEAPARAGRDFVYVGRLSEEKGIGTLIDAAVAAGVDLTVVGTGPEEAALRARAAKAPRVKFAGFMTGAPLREVIMNARALVLPSEWYENAPISILEAYAAGRPVIGARIGGIPEMIRDDQTGATFESGKVDALTAVLARFAAHNDAALVAMGQAGRRWVETDFSPERHRTLLMEEYRGLGVPC